MTFTPSQGSVLVYYPLLHPDGLGPYLDGLLHHGRDVLGPSEDVHHLHGLGDRTKVWITPLPQDLGSLGMDGDDLVALFLQLTGHAVARPVWPGGEPHRRYGLKLP